MSISQGVQAPRSSYLARDFFFCFIATADALEAHSTRHYCISKMDALCKRKSCKIMIKSNDIVL